MSLILSGTDGLSDVDGTAATPAIRGTDANTGIFFGTDIIGFSEGGVEAMRITSAGDLGLGTTSPQVQTWRAGTYLTVANASTRGQIETDAAVADSSSAALGALLFSYSTNTTNHKTVALIEANSEGATANQRGGSLNFYTKANGTASPARNMVLDSSGNLGIGTSSPTALLTAGSLSDGTPATYGGTIKVASATQTSINSVGGIELNVATGYSTKIQQISSGGANLTFCGRQSSATWSEYMRIDPSGRLLVGATSAINSETGLGVQNSTSGNPVVVFRNSRNTSGDVCLNLLVGSNCQNTSSYLLQGGVSGVANVIYIFGNGNVVNTNNSYGSLSDAKIKENIVDATPKLADLMQVKVRSYNLIGSTTKQLGVIAQELETVFPKLIDESTDYEQQTKTREVEIPAVAEVQDNEGNIVTEAVEATTRTEEYIEQVSLGTTTKSVKYSVFVPMLIKAMQEQQALITALTTRITALETP